MLMAKAWGEAMRRRDLIKFIGGVAATWPVGLRAQQTERMRSIGVLSGLVADDAAGKARIRAFQQKLQQLGWTDGRNVRIDIRWSASHADHVRKYAAELVASAPDVILAAGGSSVVGPLMQATRTVPIVFASATVPSPTATSTAWRDRAAMQLVSWRTDTARAANGWGCSSE